MRTKIILFLSVVAVLCLPQAAKAHHAFAAEYDSTKPVTLKGTVTRMEWTNPHGWIFLDVKDAKGVKHWKIETCVPSQMAKRGLKKTDFLTGGTIEVKGYAGKTDPNLANGRKLALADGRSFFIGSVGGPNDGADR